MDTLLESHRIDTLEIGPFGIFVSDGGGQFVVFVKFGITESKAVSICTGARAATWQWSPEMVQKK